MTRLLIRITLAIVCLAAGLSAGLGYGYLRLGKERQIHQNKLNELSRKVSQFQKKASDEREAHSVADGKNRSLQAELDKLKKENGEQAEGVKKLEGEKQSLETKLKETAEETARMKAARDAVGTQLAQALQAVKDFEGQGKLLAAGKQTLETSLTRVNQDLDTCRTHNARLCIIANEMIEKGNRRSEVGDVLRKEPLTQIGRVELERLAQEYKEKIEQEKVKIKQ